MERTDNYRNTINDVPPNCVAFSDTHECSRSNAFFPLDTILVRHPTRDIFHASNDVMEVSENTDYPINDENTSRWQMLEENVPDAIVESVERAFLTLQGMLNTSDRIYEFFEGPRGMGASKIDDIRSSKYTGPVEETAGGDSCNICRADYQKSDDLRHLLCRHTFHRNCLAQWLKINAVCPLCRRQVE